MGATTYFDGLTFNFFGINNPSNAKTKSYPKFYGVQYIHSGRFYLGLNNGKVYQLNGPAAFLTSPETLFEYGSVDDAPRNHCYVCFIGERVKSFLQSGLFRLAAQSEKPYVKISSPERFLSDMLELILLLQNKERHDFAVAKLEYILLFLQNQSLRENVSSFHQAAIEQIGQRIMTSPEKEWDFGAEASKLNISLKHFMLIFRNIQGMPPCHFVLRQRLFKAAGMLIQEKTSVKTIAHLCGFKNEFYFSRVFKKYMQIAPTDYRNKNIYTQGPYRPPSLKG